MRDLAVHKGKAQLAGGTRGRIESEDTTPAPPAMAPMLLEDPSMLLEDPSARESLWPLCGGLGAGGSGGGGLGAGGGDGLMRSREPQSTQSVPNSHIDP